MIAASASGLGFNPLNAVKSVAKTAVRVAADPNVQRTAAAAATQLNPSAVATAQQYVQRGQQYAAQVQQILRPGMAPTAVAAQVQQILRPGMAPTAVAVPMPVAPPPMSAVDESNANPQRGNFLMFGLIGAGLIAALLLARK